MVPLGPLDRQRLPRPRITPHVSPDSKSWRATCRKCLRSGWVGGKYRGTMPPDDAQGESSTPSDTDATGGRSPGQLTVPSERKSFSDLLDEFLGMVITYVRQETLDPIKALRRFLAFGFAAAVLISIGWLVLSLAVTRLLQAETMPHLTGNLSWIPYMGGVLTALAGVGLGDQPHSEGPEVSNGAEAKRGFAGISPRYVPGSGPGGRVEITDLRAKLGEIQGEVDETTEKTKPYLTFAARRGRAAGGHSGLRSRQAQGSAQSDLGRGPAPVTALETAVRFGLRRGWERGILDGNSTWVVIGGMALLAYLAGRALPRSAQTVFSQVLEPGDGLRITHEAPS